MSEQKKNKQNQQENKKNEKQNEKKNCSDGFKCFACALCLFWGGFCGAERGGDRYPLRK